MDDLIEDIINRAKVHQQEGMSDFDIACFVHIELGKIIYYDNNYTAKLNSDESDTELSRKRKSKLLEAETKKSSKAQICKGMAEIYAEVLNKLGIEAKAIGTKKGETQPLSQDEAEHYCTIFRIGEQEYVQDFLIESALARIKIGEAQLSKKMPGICRIDEYGKRSEMKTREVELAQEYINKTFENASEDLDANSIVKLVFEELNRNLRESEYEWGFEEAKDFAISAIVGVLKKTGLENAIKTFNIINLVKEEEKQCGVACIYEINGKKYLVRGEDRLSDIDIPAGEISDEDLVQILNQGYNGRSESERKYIDKKDNLLKRQIRERQELENAINDYKKVKEGEYDHKEIRLQLVQNRITRARQALSLTEDELRFIRPRNRKDIEYRVRQLHEFPHKIKGIVPDDLQLRFHGCPIQSAERILKSGEISSPEDRLGIQQAAYDVAGNIAVTSKNNIDITVNGYSGLNGDYEMPAGCIFVMSPRDEDDANKINSLWMENVYFRDEPDRLYGIITTPENIDRVTRWAKESGVSPDKIHDYDDFIRIFERTKDEEKIESDKQSREMRKFNVHDFEQFADSRESGEAERILISEQKEQINDSNRDNSNDERL